MATPTTHEITHIQIGDETFEIVDAIARDTVSLIFKWGRPSKDVRYPIDTSNGQSYITAESKNKFLVIAHVLPTMEDFKMPHKNSTIYAGGDGEWKTDWGYPSNFNIDNLLSDFKFAFGQLNCHTTVTRYKNSQNNTITDLARNRNIRTFVLDNIKYERNPNDPDNPDADFADRPVGKGTDNNGTSYDDWDIIRQYGPGRTYKDSSGIEQYAGFKTWAWSTFYSQATNDQVFTNTFITTKAHQVQGAFGIWCDQNFGNVWGNATTVIFSHTNIAFSNTNDEEIILQSQSEEDGN